MALESTSKTVGAMLSEADRLLKEKHVTEGIAVLNKLGKRRRELKISENHCVSI